MHTPNANHIGCAARHAGAGLTLSLMVLLTACDNTPPGPPPIPSTQITAVDTPPPEYPIELACQSIGGKVVLSLTIGTDGKPGKVEVIQPHRAEALNIAAQEAVRNWQFNPATRKGEPIESVIKVPMTFNPPSVRPQRCFALDEASGQSGG